jgi:molybdenum cofactor cytidylyltransferase
VVTGRDAAEIGKIAAGYGLRCAHNERYAAGIGTSIASGAASLKSELTGIFVALGDMPLIEEADYKMLAQGFRRRAIVLPTYRGMKGHPVLFCASYRLELSALAGDEGARSLFRRHSDATLEVALHNSGILMDVDRSEDFAREEKS